MKSTIHTALSCGALVALMTVAPAPAQDEPTTAVDSASHHTIVAAADLKWGDAPPTLPRGAKIAVLQGDPTKSGPFTIRLKVPDGYKIAPHTHPTFEAITVLSGTFNMGAGGVADADAAKHLISGGFVLMPAGTQHFASATGETIIQVSSEGPFVINYVNPNDDPSRGK